MSENTHAGQGDLIKFVRTYRPLLIAGFLLLLVGLSAIAPKDHSSSSSVAPTQSSREVPRIGEVGYLRSRDGGSVLVFTSQDGMSKAVQLRDAGADTRLIMPYIACLAPYGAKVLVITGEITGAFMSGLGGTTDVMVTEGARAGCKGVVRDEDIRKSPP
jgi:hypothetical protein